MEMSTRNDIQQKKIIKLQREKRKKKEEEQHQLMKVVYFSNPVMVTTSAAGFRAIVQELTGRDSQIADILAHQQPPAASAAYVGRGSHHQLAASGSGVFDLPLPVADFSAAGDPFEVLLYDGFGSVEDFDAGVLLDQPLLFETQNVGGGGGLLWGRF